MPGHQAWKQPGKRVEQLSSGGRRWDNTKITLRRMQGTCAGKGVLGSFREGQNYKTRYWYFCQVETERASDAKRSGGKEEEKAEEKGISALQLNRTKEGAVTGRQQPGIVSFPHQPEIFRSGRFQHHSPRILGLAQLEGKGGKGKAFL